MSTRIDPLTGMPIFVREEKQTGRGGGISGGGGVQSVVAGSNVSVDSSDPRNPVVSSTGGGSPSVFITEGATGITTIRWASTSGAVLYDMTVDDTGHVVTTAVAVGTAGSPIGLLLALTYPT